MILGRLRAVHLAGLLALIALGNVVWVVVAYGLYPGYSDHGESAMAAAAFRLLQGNPVYYPLDAPERITNLYGPWTYLWHAWAPGLFGPGLVQSKIAGLLAPLLAIGAIGLFARRCGPLGLAVALALAGTFTLMHLPFTVAIRPDSLLTLLVAGALFAALAAERPGVAWGASLLIGALAGIAVDIKIHAGVYLLPVIALHLSHDIRRAGPVALAGAVALALPFVSPLFPLPDYLAWFGPVAAKENSWNGLRVVWMKLAFYLGLPVAAWALAGWRAMGRGDRLFLAAYLVSVLLTLFPATKVGASHHYFLPFLPVMIVLALRALDAAGGRPAVGRLLVGLTALALFLTAQTERRFFKSFDWPEARAVAAEIGAVIKAHPAETIQMGIGSIPEHYYLYSWRALPVFAGSPYTIDSGIVMELTKLGVPMPAETLRRLAACQTRLWLIPAGEAPFALKGYYDQRIFGDTFRDTFLAHHDRVMTTGRFDLWRCRE